MTSKSGLEHSVFVATSILLLAGSAGVVAQRGAQAAAGGAAVGGQVELADGTKRAFSSLAGLEMTKVATASGSADAYIPRPGRLFFRSPTRDVVVDLAKAASIAFGAGKPGGYDPVEVKVTWRDGSVETFPAAFAGFEVVWSGSQLIDRHLVYFGLSQGTSVFGGATIIMQK
jgi:hypothetical protein